MNASCNLDGLHTSGTHLYTLSIFLCIFITKFFCLALKHFSLILNSLCLVIFLYPFRFPIFLFNKYDCFM